MFGFWPCCPNTQQGPEFELGSEPRTVYYCWRNVNLKNLKVPALPVKFKKSEKNKFLKTKSQIFMLPPGYPCVPWINASQFGLSVWSTSITSTHKNICMSKEISHIEKLGYFASYGFKSESKIRKKMYKKLYQIMMFRFKSS